MYQRRISGEELAVKRVKEGSSPAVSSRLKGSMARSCTALTWPPLSLCRGWPVVRSQTMRVASAPPVIRIGWPRREVARRHLTKSVWPVSRVIAGVVDSFFWLSELGRGRTWMFLSQQPAYRQPVCEEVARHVRGAEAV